MSYAVVIGMANPMPALVELTPSVWMAVLIPMTRP